ncbi:MAG: Tm-1-like ATP-binding domain-containing protein [Pirellulaceae bacterium]
MSSAKHSDSHVFAIGTMDTKGDELQFVAQQLRERGVSTVTVDVGTGQSRKDRPTSLAKTSCKVTGMRSPTLRRIAVRRSPDGASLRQYLLNQVAPGASTA